MHIFITLPVLVFCVLIFAALFYLKVFERKQETIVNSKLLTDHFMSEIMNNVVGYSIVTSLKW